MIEWKSDVSVLPLIGIAREQPASGHQLKAWLLDNKEQVDELLCTHGAVLFREFRVASAEEFQDIASIFCHRFGSYVGGNSPRTRVTSHVFTSTEYPKDEQISMHNEASYLKRMPRHILFFCLKPATRGGQTPLADCRRVLNRIDPDVRSRFARSGVLYVNNLHGGIGLGKSWMEAYGAKDRREVEACLGANDHTFEWKADSSLRISMKAPATLLHPMTQEEAWINQAEQWHSSSLESSLREELLSILSEDELPHNAFLGDGAPLSESDLQNIREVMAAEEHIFEW